MADRTVVGDTIRLTNSFYVGTTLTDPTTVTLVVTDPSANTEGTYTYAGSTITKSATGVYYKDLTVDEDGVWEYTWTGTGTAADIATGTFNVWLTATDDIDLLTVPEAKAAVGLAQTNVDQDEYLRTLVTAVSAQIDQLCGPVRTRTVTSELHDGGYDWIRLRKFPVYSITTVTEYTSTSAQTLTAETNAAKTATNYLHDGTAATIHSGLVRRRANNGDSCFADGRRNIEVTYVAGRHPSTEVVAAKFKQACAMMLRTVWVGEQASGTQTFQENGLDPTVALLGPKLLNRVSAQLEGDLIDGVMVL